MNRRMIMETWNISETYRKPRQIFFSPARIDNRINKTYKSTVRSIEIE